MNSSIKLLTALVHYLVHLHIKFFESNATDCVASHASFQLMRFIDKLYNTKIKMTDWDKKKDIAVECWIKHNNMLLSLIRAVFYLQTFNFVYSCCQNKYMSWNQMVRGSWQEEGINAKNFELNARNQKGTWTASSLGKLNYLVIIKVDVAKRIFSWQILLYSLLLFVHTYFFIVFQVVTLCTPYTWLVCWMNIINLFYRFQIQSVFVFMCLFYNAAIT